MDEAVKAWLAVLEAEEGPREGFQFQPRTLKQVLGQALSLGRKLGRTEAAIQWIGQAEFDLKRMQQKYGFDPRRLENPPKVACLNDFEPLISAGLWVPDLVDQAGGVMVLNEKGNDPRPLSWEDLVDAKPDFLLILHPSEPMDALQERFRGWEKPPLWSALPAVQRGDVYVWNGTLAHSPSPDLYAIMFQLIRLFHLPQP